MKRQISCAVLVALVTSSVVPLNAQGPPAAQAPYQPPAMRFDGPGLTMADALKLTLQHDPSIKLRETGVARQMGVRSFRVKLATFALAAFLTGVAGGLQALKLGAIEPYGAFGMAWTIDTVAVVIIGGIATRGGPIVGTLVYVALGGFDATYMNNCKLWDIAAGALIVTEVGGRVTDPRGKPLFPMDLDAYRGEEMPTLASRGDESSHRLMP